MNNYIICEGFINVINVIMGEVQFHGILKQCSQDIINVFIIDDSI